MNYLVIFRPLAASKLQEAYNWYESQQDGLGEIFLKNVEKTINKIKLNPTTFSFYKKPIRKAALLKFPYTLVYEIDKALIVIYSVFMQKQNPQKKRTK